MQWLYQLARALFETVWKGIASAPPKSVGTDVGAPGSAARFMQRVRADRDARARAARDKNSSAHG